MRRFTPPVLIGLAISLLSAPAAALMQPNGTVIPTPLGCDAGQPSGLGAIFACVCTTPGICNIGPPCPSQTTCSDGMNGTCETTLWHSFNDNTCIPSNESGLDPFTAASVTPATYHPSCPLTFDLLSRGTALFQNAFGWYNATGQQPPASDLHVMQDCSATAGQSVVLDLSTEPAYLGGDIGFFLVNPESHTQPSTCAGGDCCATVARATSGEGYVYYSEMQYNPDYVGASPYIHMLTYQSQLQKEKFYFAWEDTFQTTSGDFTDFVTGVSGIQCSGGGVACDTGKLGVCAAGITQCSQGAVSCSEIFPPSPEQCNGLDDDCNGQIDDGAVCPTGEICYQGACVPHCSSGEFPCSDGTVCDAPSGLCLDAGCVGVTCPAGQVCTAGACRAPCAGVVCPRGQSCVGDECVDLCKGVACAAGQVCEDGKCFSGCASCDGIACTSPLKCQASTGECADTSCTGTCPAGTFCSMGQCVGACTGVVCPPGQGCLSGECTVGAPDAGADGGFFGGVGGGPASSGSGGAGAGGAPGFVGSGPTFNTPSGCGCAEGSAQRSGLGLVMVAFVFGAPGARRRRSGARPPR